MSSDHVSLWKCQRCGHEEADHLGVQTLPVAKVKSRLVPDVVNESGKCHVDGCDCREFQGADQKASCT
jgi:hypothetical protein